MKPPLRAIDLILTKRLLGAAAQRKKPIQDKPWSAFVVNAVFLLDPGRRDCEALPVQVWILRIMTKSELHLKDPHGAMIKRPTIWLRGPTDKSLSDLRFVVKDLFDVAGVPTAGGSPDWLQTSTLPQTVSYTHLTLPTILLV